MNCTSGIIYSHEDVGPVDYISYKNDTLYGNSNLSVAMLEPLCNSNVSVPKFRVVTKLLDLYFVPILIFIGLIGNTISFLVFSRTSLRRLSASVYLAALSMSDNGFLFCVFMSWSSNIGLHLYNTHGWCQTFVYLSYVCSFLSVWYVIGFTVERYIAICFPFRRGTLCTVRRAKMVVVGLATIAAILYCWGIWTSRPQKLECSEVFLCHIDPYHYQLVKTMSNVDTVLTLIVPCPAIIILNSRIIWVLSRHKENVHTGPSGSVKMVTIRSFSNQINNSSTRRSHILNLTSRANLPKYPKCTRMLLVVSSVFIILNLPAHSLRIFFFFAALLDMNYLMSLGEEYVALQEFFTYIFYANFAINIFLYSLCGANFRRSVLVLFRLRSDSSTNRRRSTLAFSQVSDGSKIEAL